MAKKSDFIDDLNKLVGSSIDMAVKSSHTLKQKYDTVVAEKISDLMTKHKIVSREEFDVVKKLLDKIVKEQQALSKKIEQLSKNKK